ncbi:MAG: hypothetical protein K2P73_16640 [Lachnospiraceae bacterium]|nr:hypothetical protein [Lachnospiraceae bacterium]
MDKEIYKNELEKFSTKEDGLYYLIDRIGYDDVKVINVNMQYDIRTDSIIITYTLCAVYKDGKISDPVQVKSLDKISLFALFRIPDINESGKEQRLIRKKLELEAALLEPEKCICCHQGLQQYDGNEIWIMGDQIISAGQLTTPITIEPQYPFPDIHCIQKDCIPNFRESIIRLLPGVSEILFYYSLSAITKMILHEVSIDTNFTLAVVGPSGHLKTSMVKKIALWLSDKGMQQFNFSSHARTSQVLEAMDRLSGMNYLIDDFHMYTKSQDIERQNKRLDDIVRHIESSPDCANAIVTGEHIQGIFSCIDRILVIHIPRMDSDKLTTLKAELGIIPDNTMSMIAYLFVQELINHIEEVREDCKQFYQDNYVKTIHDASNPTRTYRHCCFIKLTEFLYCKYCCGHSERLSARDELYKALEKQYAIQQEQLRKLSITEQHDYVLGVKDMLDAEEGKYLRIETDIEQYDASYNNCYLANDQVYITSQALTYGMNLYYGTSIKKSEVARALENTGVLIRGSDTLTKKFGGKRHYVIHLKLLNHYVHMKQNQDTDFFA